MLCVTKRCVSEHKHINRNTLVKVFKALGLLLNCSPMVVVSVNVAPMDARTAQSSLGTMRDLKRGTKPQKIGENTLVVRVVISDELERG